jgi:hypothetical protein
MYFHGLRHSGESAPLLVEVVLRQETSRALIQREMHLQMMHVFIPPSLLIAVPATRIRVIYVSHLFALVGEHAPMANAIARADTLACIARPMNHVALASWIDI